MIQKMSSLEKKSNNKVDAENFSFKTPSDELIQALKEADDIVCGTKKAKGYRNMDELFNDLSEDHVGDV